MDVSLKRPEPLVIDDNLDPTASRLMLSHLGLLSLENFDELMMVQKFNDPDRKFNYLQNFAVLDKSKEYESFK